MEMYVEFDVIAELIDVPEHVIMKKDDYRNKFLDWLYNPRVKHEYRVTAYDATGKKFVGMRYGAEAFVQWLNKKVLRETGENATLVATNLEIDEQAWKAAGIPFIFF